jgi:hypothetical protein
MNQSLDGYVDHMAFAPSPALFRHFIEEAQGQAGSVYGRTFLLGLATRRMEIAAESWAENLDPASAGHLQKVLVSAHDHSSAAGYGTGEERVVVRIRADLLVNVFPTAAESFPSPFPWPARR